MAQGYFRGNTKRCNGPLHKGKYVPLSEFWYHKSGKRKGKPFSQCIDCENFNKFGDTAHGLVDYASVKFIFDELVYRIGKTETTRRIGVSANFFYRRQRDSHIRIRKATVARAMIELKKCRENQEARHRKSIRHGAKERGRKERVPVKRGEYNGKDVKMTEYHFQFKQQQRAQNLTPQSSSATSG
jgi:hypothetical protein